MALTGRGYSGVGFSNRFGRGMGFSGEPMSRGFGTGRWVGQNRFARDLMEKNFEARRRFLLAELMNAGSDQSPDRTTESEK